MSVAETLKKYAGMSNIVEEAKLDKQVVEKIGSKVLKGFNIDFNSMTEWLSDVKKIEELVALVSKKKNYPLPNSANIRYPLIAKACYEFSSRTYPEIIKDGQVVKGQIIGFDGDGEKKKRVERVSDYLNYQLLGTGAEWEKDLDKLLFDLALIGCLFKKQYYDPIDDQIKSELVDYKDLIVNADCKSLNKARRISQIIHVRLNDLLEGAAEGIYCQEVVDQIVLEQSGEELDPEIDLIEQHTFHNLVDKNYAEPYIITVLKKDGRVLRIAPRFIKDAVKAKDDTVKKITPIQYFTDFHFLVSPKGKFQSVGFGILMLHLNETINSLLNQLVDAGQLANLQGGYIDARLKDLNDENSAHDPGEWKKLKVMGGINIKDGIVPITYREPSNVLYQLVGLLIEASKDLSSSSEVMSGSTNADNAKTGAVQLLQREGIKLVASINRRVYRQMSDEFRKLFILDSIYLDENVYYNVIDDKKQIFKSDFDVEHVDIIPVADPNLSSDYQLSTKIQTLVAASQLPGIDPIKVTERILKYSNIENSEELMAGPLANKAPDPSLIKVQADIQKTSADIKSKGRELDLREKELMISLYKTQCECLKLKADAMLSLSQAESTNASISFKDYQMQLDILSKHMDTMMDVAQHGQTERHHQDEMAARQQERDQNQQDLDQTQEQSQQELDQNQQEIDNAQQSETMAGTPSN